MSPVHLSLWDGACSGLLPFPQGYTSPSAQGNPFSLPQPHHHPVIVYLMEHHLASPVFLLAPTQADLQAQATGAFLGLLPCRLSHEHSVGVCGKDRQKGTDVLGQGSQDCELSVNLPSTFESLTSFISLLPPCSTKGERLYLSHCPWRGRSHPRFLSIRLPCALTNVMNSM